MPTEQRPEKLNLQAVTTFLWYNKEVFPFQNNPKMDLDFGDFLEEKTHLEAEFNPITFRTHRVLAVLSAIGLIQLI